LADFGRTLAVRQCLFSPYLCPNTHLNFYVASHIIVSILNAD